MRHCPRIVHQRAMEPHKCEDIKTLSRLQQRFRFKRNVMRPICEEHPGGLGLCGGINAAIRLKDHLSK
ncbi:hypothetical protein CEXT_422011 [Caerostris extrusa]|uniref:Uncharacterized protein n=1 Tax=Caerostris extrusa TaxID=172846 RepID=A0AAV4QSZ8_CAEEX|nr:hypothetical protein CEXT_422011 [Caerostris extrusa]